MKKFLAIFLAGVLTSSLFAATIDFKIRGVPDAIQELTFKKPKEGLPSLVKYLSSVAGGTQAKVKIFHDWICDNIAYDADMYFSGRVSKQDYESVLKKKKAVCSGYSSLMNEMCRLAEIESIGIHGYSKGFGYKGKIGTKTDHEWNAVKINGKWQLIDVTWDAGYLDYKTFIKRYSTQWLYLTPEQFIYSHLPEKDEFQYLKEIKTKEEFQKEPYLPGVFFEYGLSLGKQSPGYTNEISEAVKYEINVSKTGISLMSDLIDKNTGSFVKNATWIDRIGSRVTADFDIPAAKDYTARILARRRDTDKIPNFYSISEFESRILPQAEDLLSKKKITQKEYEFLEASYFKVEENYRYYLLEDLFDNPRNLAIAKVLKLLNQTGSYEEVLSINIVPKDGYTGFGEGKLRFPTPYRDYNEATNIHVISPVTGVLEKGSVQKFAVETNDFSAIGVVLNGKITPFKKNQKGVFELEVTVPTDTDTLAVYGSRNGKNYTGLWLYLLE